MVLNTVNIIIIIANRSLRSLKIMFVNNHRQLNSSKTDDLQREFNGESIIK